MERLKEVRLFDNECYFCYQERPQTLATHDAYFCRPLMASMWLTENNLPLLSDASPLQKKVPQTRGFGTMAKREK
jgi:hypothetical protein